MSHSTHIHFFHAHPPLATPFSSSGVSSHHRLSCTSYIHYVILGQNPPRINPPDKTPRTIPCWIKPPDGQTPPPPVDKTHLDKTLPDKTPRDKTPRTKPPGQNPPGQNPHGKKKPGQNHPQTTPPPPDKTPHPHKTLYKTPQTQTTTAKPPRISPRSPTKHPEDKNLAKSKMAFILNSDMTSELYY